MNVQSRASLEAVQAKTFCKWLNSKLETRGLPPMTSLAHDLGDGVRLIQLMEIMGDTTLGRYNGNPRIRVQKAENVTLALRFIKERGVHLTNIAAEDIIDGNLKLILGLIWTLILRFTIADISEEGLSAKDGLLLWVQRKTADYKPDVDVQEFTWSWTDGLALCALIHKHRPDLIDYHALDKTDRAGNTELAFKVAEQQLGIARLLDVSDLVEASQPDERSVMTYVAEFFHAFSKMNKKETGQRRVEKFLDTVQNIWSQQNDYTRRAYALLSSLSTQASFWDTSCLQLPATYPAVRSLSHGFKEWKKSDKRAWVKEKGELGDLLSSIRMKLRTYGMLEWEPEEDCRLEVVEREWRALGEGEENYSRIISRKLKEIKDSLSRQAAAVAEELHSQLRDLELELNTPAGDLDDQKVQVLQMQADRIPPLDALRRELAQAEDECANANVDENDYTVLNWDDLSWEYELLKTSLSRRIAVIDNQIVSRETTNLTPAQLEEFESTFRHFDVDGNNTLAIEEFEAALAALSISFSTAEIDNIFDELVETFGALNFKAFTSFLVEIIQDTDSPQQLQNAFREIAGNKPYVTELDLQVAQVPKSSIDFFKSAAVSTELEIPGDLKADERETVAYDFDGFLKETFGDP